MTQSRFAPLPTPPYYAVIFTNQLAETAPGYDAMADKIFELAQTQQGYLGAETTRDATGLGITVSYWADEAAIQAWKQVSEHLIAQKLGIKGWYERYNLRVAKVERAYSGPQGRSV
ncbi:antibiotic biosynthesis monooxygenase [Aliiroseovarius sp. F47248L]|uniref:antibiotic biosynthesis monooxygenase family protein n=1 Tax=Aliiroseovarius sp. F47248L TaxID=2926420 RepID=UPI001FF314C7|nr:antibiotic biosynthesis monooxygenase [Aliiroseovarius sp. F47248L]MCK0138729.1 antibiotic biosynthesis monooxygenase [Aliiroseovarius sp. F47248L]